MTTNFYLDARQKLAALISDSEIMNLLLLFFFYSKACIPITDVITLLWNHL